MTKTVTVTEPPKAKRKRSRVDPLEVLVFTDGSEPGEPIMYIKAFHELPQDLQRRMRNKHLSFHEIDEKRHATWEQRVADLIGHSSAPTVSSLTAIKQREMKSIRFTEWMADPVRRHTPLSVVSSFTWGQ